MFICAGKNEVFDFAKSIGVGLIESAIGLTRICLQNVPTHLIFLGSAGSYDDKIQIGEIFYSFCATQIELSFLENKSYTPIDNSIQLESFSIVSCETLTKQYQTHLLDIPQVIVNSSNYITNTSLYNTLMLHAGIKLENMELFSVFQVARYFGIPCFAILCVSNYIHENAHEEFLKYHIFVKEKLCKFIENKFVL